VKNRITYYPPATQRLLQENAAKIRGKPYARFFNADLWLHDAVMPAIARAMDPSQAIAPDAAGLNSLLDPGYHEVENGYCELPDGTGYVASLVPMPGCTGDMYKWWFWWHAVEPARYTLWYPTNHIAANPLDRRVLTAPGLSHEQRYVGTTHHVDEYIGPERVQIAISFETAHGIEQRSRYWIGHNAELRVLNMSLSVDRWGDKLGIKRRMAGARMAYEQLLHDQIEFTHLATFLPELFAEFSNR
jgi:hypothetical protein